MKFLKRFRKDSFGNFSFFYRYLGYRFFLTFSLSLIVGLLDGLGLAMFLPLLEMLDSGEAVTNDSMGNLGFILSFLEFIGLEFTLTVILSVMAFFFISKGLAKFVETYYQVLVQQFFLKSLRIETVRLLGAYDYNNFVNTDAGRIQNTLTGEMDKIVGAYRSYVATLRAGIVLLVYIGLAYLANPEFALLVSVGGFLSNLAFKTIYNRTKKISREVTQGGHAYQLMLLQMVNSFKYLKATSLISVFVSKVEDLTIEIEEGKRKMGFLESILLSVREPIVVVIVVIVILIEVTYLGQDLGLIILSLLFFYRGLTFVIQIQSEWNKFLKVSGALENLFDFRQLLVSGKEEYKGSQSVVFEKAIELKNVFFNYGDLNVLNDISLEIQKNKSVAFVGESGSGKTTIVNTITGLISPKSGEILLDGKELYDLDLLSYRSSIGYITQEPVIFNDDIFNNVTFWSERTPENEARFWESLNKASIDTFVKELPDAENAVLGNNGINLSGGQRQRLSIARELYKDVEILIMDEATSALDSQTEKEIQKNIDSLKGEYTILMVAHRLSTIRNADIVIILDKGRIVDKGTYNELLGSSGTFKRMVELQEL